MVRKTTLWAFPVTNEQNLIPLDLDIAKKENSRCRLCGDRDEDQSNNKRMQ